MDKYYGARFYKCDLHMHTPLDRNWRDAATKLKVSDSDERKREVARLYLKACHGAELEVIAITDHNFAPSPELSFLPWLTQENKHVADELHKCPLVIFPGFEIEADVGTGHHVICVLPPEVPLNVIETRVTDCGLGADQRYDSKGLPRPSTERLPEIIKAIQRCERWKGIVVCAHPFNEKGLLCDESAKMWLQQEEYKNEDLLCIEIPKPIEEMSQGFQKLIRGGEDCDPEWRRKRPIAYVMSSDCQRMTPETNDAGNSIGYRHTWIKMSEPSIESLRQAFLDYESRIRFGNVKPEALYKYPRIERIQVEGASFYRAEPVVLSGNLNCLIGSRGTGKSTVIDYVRLALDRLREDDLPRRIKTVVDGRNFGTLNQGGRITVHVRRDGVPYEIEYAMDSGSERKVTNLDSGECDSNLDVRSLFNVRFLSQHEIDESVDDPSRLRRLLDGFLTNELDALVQESKGIVAKIELASVRLDELKGRQLQRPTLETEKAQLEATLKLLERLKVPSQRWEGMLTEESEFQSLLEWCATLVIQFRKHLEQLCLALPNVADTPNRDMVSQAVTIAKSAYESFFESVASSIAAFEDATLAQDAPMMTVLVGSWVPVYEKEKEEFKAVKQELEAAGHDPNSFLEYKRQLEETERKLQNLDTEFKEIEQLESNRGKLLGDLRECWWRETKLRQAKAKDLMDRLRIGGTQTPLVEIRIEHEGELRELANAMYAFIEDERSLNHDDLESVVDAVAAHVRMQWSTGQLGSQVSIVQQILDECRLGLKSEILPTALNQKRCGTFVRTFGESRIRTLEVERIPDKVSLYVHRQDGTMAGPIEKVSAGQKGLAYLNLLLAAGDEPLVIDTPEEGLDSEGVYSELVPLFRREKEARQITVATHNANIPVNADAELVIALESVGYIPKEDVEQKCEELESALNSSQIEHACLLIKLRRWEDELRGYLVGAHKWPTDKAQRFVDWVGSTRQAIGVAKRLKPSPSEQTSTCIGGLDRWSVKEAVLSIMEGSKKAFERRREKYGF